MKPASSTVWLVLIGILFWLGACGNDGSSGLPDPTDDDDAGDEDNTVTDGDHTPPADGDLDEEEDTLDEDPAEDGDLDDAVDDEPEEDGDDGDVPDGDDDLDNDLDDEPEEDGDEPDGDLDDTVDVEPEQCPDLTCEPGPVDECHYYDVYQGLDGCPACRYNEVQNEQACQMTLTGLCYDGHCYPEWGDLNCEDQAENCPEDSTCRVYELHEQTLVYCAYCEEIWPREGGPCFTAADEPGQCHEGECIKWILPDGDIEEDTDSDVDEDGDSDLDLDLDEETDLDEDEVLAEDGDLEPDIPPCTPGRKRCYPGDEASYQVCQASQTWGTPILCDDSVDCSRDICFGPGLCGSDGVNVGAPCDDFNGSTIDDVCLEDGSCWGTLVEPDGDDEEIESDEEEWCQFGAECCENQHCIDLYGPGHFCEMTTYLCVAEDPICEPYDEICCRDDPANIDGCLDLGSDMIRAFATCSSTGGSWQLQTSQMCGEGQGCSYNEYDSAICISGMCADDGECDSPAICNDNNVCEIPILQEGEICDDNGAPTGACDVGLYCCIGDDTLGTCEIACGGDDPDWEPQEETKRKIPVKKGYQGR